MLNAAVVEQALDIWYSWQRSTCEGEYLEEFFFCRGIDIDAYEPEVETAYEQWYTSQHKPNAGCVMAGWD